MIFKSKSEITNSADFAIPPRRDYEFGAKNRSIRRNAPFGASLVFATMLMTGCGPRPTSLDKPETLPFAGVKLTAAVSPRCPHRNLIDQRIASWSVRSGAKIEISSAVDAPADLYLFEAAELGRLAEEKILRKISDEFRGNNAPYDWNDLASPYSSRLCVWAGVPYGVPLMGEGQVLVYRSDKLSDPAWQKVFREKFGRDWEAPQTWDELAAWAEFSNKADSPSLPPLPKSEGDLERLFYDIAVCYDRRTLTQADVGERMPDADEIERLLAFHYDLKKYEPRIDKPAFVYALSLLQKMQKCRPSESGDPVEAIKTGKAMFAVLKLDELARLKGTTGFSVAPLPGASFTYDYRSDKRMPNNAAGGVNRMPYIGWGSMFGGVGAQSTQPAAAYDFLADFGLPLRTSLELIAAAQWGAGPYRKSHEETRNLSRWLGYGLDKANTDQLLQSLHYQNGSSITNYRLCLRVPDERQHTEILVEELRKALMDQTNPVDCLGAVKRRWMQLDEQQPKPIRQAWIRHSLGL